MPRLRVLNPTAKHKLTAAFLEGTAGVDLTDHAADFHREVKLGPVSKDRGGGGQALPGRRSGAL